MPDTNEPTSESAARTFKAFGFEVPLPNWAMSVLAMVVIVAVAGYLYNLIYNEPTKQLVSLKQINEQLSSDVREYGNHVMESPALREKFSDSDGDITIGVFADHCILIQQRTREGSFTRLVQDLARTGVSERHAIWPDVPSPVAVLAASSFGGTCWNPHPGAFSWAYGERRGDWVEVWRWWPDGCRHFQMFHPSSGAWATNSDGTPSVNWTACMH